MPIGEIDDIPLTTGENTASSETLADYDNSSFTLLLTYRCSHILDLILHFGAQFLD
jgi:hypothetical protein